MNPNQNDYIQSEAVKEIFDGVFTGQYSRISSKNSEGECLYQQRHYCVSVHLLTHYLPTRDAETASRARRTMVYLVDMLRASADKMRTEVSETEAAATRYTGKALRDAQLHCAQVRERLEPIEDALLAAALAQ